MSGTHGTLKTVISGSDRMSLRRGRPDHELAGWHASQLAFMLRQVIHKDMTYAFLSHYLRALRPEILTILKDADNWHIVDKSIGEKVREAITIIQGEEDAKL